MIDFIDWCAEMSELNTKLLARYAKLCSDRTNIERMWEAIVDYILPYRGDFFDNTGDELSVDWFRERDAYDSTAIMAHQMLAASLHGALTSPASQWFLMRFRDSKLNKNKAAKEWLEDGSKKVFFALQDSNFNLEVNETYQDVAGFGTAFLCLEEEGGPANTWNGLEFNSIPIKEGYFESNARGNIERFFRHLKWTPTQILSKFGDNVPESIKALEEKGSTDRLDVIWCVYPTGNKVTAPTKKVARSRRPYEARYILKDTKETIGKPVGYYEMPVFAPRWRKTSDSEWGNSPAMIALADVLSLNQAREMQMISSEKMIDPPMMAEERSLITDLDVSAASLTVVRSVEGIKPLLTGGQINVSDMMVEQLQDAIRNYFFMDQLTFPSPQAQPMTATEAQIRYEQMQRLLGPTMGRLQSDLLDPLVSRVFRMLSRDGVIPPPPQEVIDANAELDIEYMGSLVRAQNSDKAAAIERWTMGLGNMAAVLPDILDVVDDVGVGRQYGEDLNIPATLMHSDIEVKKKRTERKQNQQQAEQAMLAEQQGKAVQEVAAGEEAAQEAMSDQTQ